MVEPSRPAGSSAATVGGLLGALALGLVLGPPAALRAADEVSADDPAGEHVPLRLLDGRLHSTSAEEADEIVDITAYCNSCHGDSSEDAESEATGHAGDSVARDHPVDVAYPGADPDYRAPGELDPGLLLLEGRLSCVTCHAHDDRDHVLVLPTRSSEICRACHLM